MKMVWFFTSCFRCLSVAPFPLFLRLTLFFVLIYDYLFPFIFFVCGSFQVLAYVCFMCVCVYIYMYGRMDVHIHVCTCVFSVFSCAQMTRPLLSRRRARNRCIYAHRNVSMHIYIYYIQTHVYIYIYILPYTCTLLCISIYLRRHIICYI